MIVNFKDLHESKEQTYNKMLDIVTEAHLKARRKRGRRSKLTIYYATFYQISCDRQGWGW